MASYGMVSPDWQPLVTLVEDILRRAWDDLVDAEPICLSVSATHSGNPDGNPDGQAEGFDLVRLAAVGADDGLVEAQFDKLSGPVLEAMRSGSPVVTADLWADPRWPSLTREAMVAGVPSLTDDWHRITGMAVTPTNWQDDGIFALSCVLARPADESTIEQLSRYENLVAAALVVVQTATVEGPQQVLEMLQSRGVIEQAKGAIIAAANCDADTAWNKLRFTSQHLNIRVRDLAVALVEHLGNAPAEHPVGLPAVTPDDRSRDGAARLWKTVTNSDDLPDTAASRFNPPLP